MQLHLSPKCLGDVQVHLTPKYLGLVLEYAPGGDLFQYIQSHGSLTETEARRIFQQVTADDGRPATAVLCETNMLGSLAVRRDMIQIQDQLIVSMRPLLSGPRRSRDICWQ